MHAVGAEVDHAEEGVLRLRGGEEAERVPCHGAVVARALERVVDPTGAGDSFAGGFMGTIAATGDTSTEGLRRAAVVGSVMGSFTVEDFSADRLASLTVSDIRKRFSEFQSLTAFDGFPEL